MLSRSLIGLLIASLAFALVGCSDRRPKASVAQAEFARLYPRAEVVSVRISMDEVVARSFEFTYRRPGEPQTKTLEIQYVKNNRGDFEISPPAPADLP